VLNINLTVAFWFLSNLNYLTAKHHPSSKCRSAPLQVRTNESLIVAFTESEVRNAVFQMEHNKAPGPDRFLAEFYQVFWGIIKADLLPLFVDLHREELDLYSLNFGIITLIPKINNATKIQ
jgi:hypothetical protein